MSHDHEQRLADAKMEQTDVFAKLVVQADMRRIYGKEDMIEERKPAPSPSPVTAKDPDELPGLLRRQAE